MESYRAKSDSRQIAASDLLSIFDAAIRRFAVIPRTPLVPITVYDETGYPVTRVHSIFSATFIADREDGHWQVEDGYWIEPRDLPFRSQCKSHLRRYLRNGLVTVEEACQVLNCCPYALVAMQLEEPMVDLAAPDIDGLTVSTISRMRGWGRQREDRACAGSKSLKPRKCLLCLGSVGNSGAVFTFEISVSGFSAALA
ncbi:hypothetical protein N2600_03960 [Rhizobium sp. WSM1274]|uniref:hypothetical protein n=1 Tax=Rhizobium sp. WSM1274 TaxID=3138254 RepID=UPI0021A351C4|nr:hypothetical protein [Rhizobium leguminosarum]UWU29136.1 hypothetical protein N2600_03960 [Rhizobium leguminosarum bv. viciae]